MKINLNTVFKILITALLFSLLALFFSCDIQKEASKTKTDTGFNENIETKTFRKGDTVAYEIPNVIFKDTVIYRKNTQGTILKTVYDKSGSIASIDCFASAIEEFKKENREFRESIKDKESTKKEEMNTTWILYGFIMIAVIICFALFLGFIYIKKNTSIVTGLLK